MQHNLEHLIGVLLSRSEQFEQAAMTNAKNRDLTVRQLHCLETIHILQHPTPSELARALKISKPSATVMIDKLVEKDYVEKVKTDEDRRIAHIHLTKKGIKASQWHDEVHQDFAALLLRDLSGEEIFQLEKILAKALKRVL
jgi:DNA-binding MarR family transcriptional regulator